MKSLPFEGNTSVKQHLHQSKKHRNLPADPKVAKYRIEIKKISQRLSAYADGAKVPDREVLSLLEDTRMKVISMHVARKNIRQTAATKRNPRRRRH